MAQGKLRHEARALLVLGLPLIGSQLAQFSMHLTNTILLGWYSVEALAALVLALSLFFTIFILCSAYAWAVMPVVAAAAANDDDVEVRRTTRMGFWLTMLAALVTFPIFWFAEDVLLALKQPPEVAKLAGVYLRITGWCIFPATAVMVLRSYLAGLERTQVVLWVTIITAVLNALLNYALIFGYWGAPELGLRGAAYTTLIVQTLSFLVLAAYVAFYPAFHNHAIFVRFWRPDWPAFGAVFRLGWPISLTSLSEHGLFAAASVMMGWVGTKTLAAHGIALEITAAFFMVHVGLSQASTVRAGRAFGKNDRHGLRLVGLGSYAIALGIMIPTITLFVVKGDMMVGLFLATDNPERAEIITIGAALLVVAAFFQLADSGQVVTLGLLRGIQDTKVPMIMAAISYWCVGIPAGYFFGFHLDMGGTGIWAGLICGLMVAFTMLAWRYWSRILPTEHS